MAVISAASVHQSRAIGLSNTRSGNYIINIAIIVNYNTKYNLPAMASIYKPVDESQLRGPDAISTHHDIADAIVTRRVPR